MAATVVVCGHRPRQVFCPRHEPGRPVPATPTMLTMGGTDKDDILVGNPERERAIGLLNDAFSSGYLDVTAFEDRSGAVYAARTRGQLRVTVDGLPTAASLFPDEPAAALARPATSVPMQLDVNWQTVRRRGVWEVPPRILVTGSMGTADLDFSNAVFRVPLMDLELQVSASSVKVRLGRTQGDPLPGSVAVGVVLHQGQGRVPVGARRTGHHRDRIDLGLVGPLHQAFVNPRPMESTHPCWGCPPALVG